MASARRVGLNENISTYGGVGRGRDYTDLAIWEAATDTDLVTAQQSEGLKCFNDEVFDDNLDAGVGLSGATTNEDYFRRIFPADGHKHDGTPNEGVRFSHVGNNGLFLINESFTQVQDIVGTVTSNESGTRVTFIANADEATCVGCISANSTNDGAGGYRGFATGSSGNARLVNCLSINNKSEGFLLGDISNGDPSAYNCTAVNNGAEGFLKGGGVGSVVSLKNCLSSGNTGDDFFGTFGGTLTNNASSDATAPGSNNRINQTFTFLNADNNDFHLTNSDTGALGHGADLSADSTYAFDDDIDVDTITTWSIGADAQVSIVAYPTQFNDLGIIGFKRSWS